MTAYRVDQPERPQPAARRASPRHIPEGIPIAAPAIPRAPPVAPASSQPSTSAEPRMAIPISEYRELCRSLETLTASQSSLAQEMAAIRACQEQMLATQAQHTAILRQLQLHFDLPPAVEPSTSTTAVPHSHPKSLRPHLEHQLKRQTHLPSPAPPTHQIIISISTAFVLLFEIDITQEVPLPPFNYNHSYHIEDNAQFVGGRMRKEPGALSLNWLGVTDLNARYKGDSLFVQYGVFPPEVARYMPQAGSWNLKVEANFAALRE
ncbi:hypothetical protein CK203_059597 [Vitis vinifera]|uniref:Uncharacterized protein n=1 Tax=Vitis vinifera TaxID=29760 RepID=A0A438GAE3_VITVI|nr:hypothetical protein CK203_059597 [Vitis vinifera]